LSLFLDSFRFPRFWREFFSNFCSQGLIHFCSILSPCKSSFFLVNFHFSLLIYARPLAPLKFLVDFRQVSTPIFISRRGSASGFGSSHIHTLPLFFISRRGVRARSFSYSPPAFISSRMCAGSRSVCLQISRKQLVLFAGETDWC
jgi:hypothetical protein